MKPLSFILALLMFGALTSAHAEKTVTDPTLEVFATDDEGKPKPVVLISRDSESRDILFKHILQDKHRKHVSWAFEISDPRGGLNYQTSLEGGIPAILHWDGYFSDGSELKLNQRYYMRVLLVYEDGTSTVSPWSFFSVKYRSRTVVLKSKGDAISLYVVPSGAVMATIARTSAQNSTVFPVYSGDLQAVYLDTHTLGIRMEASSNTFFGFNQLSPGFIYSDASAFYRYRITGSPLRAPVLPLVPGNMGFRYRPTPRSDAWGQVENMGVGLRVYYTVIHGSSASTLDPELFRFANGLALTFDYDRAFGSVRVRTGAQLGYSVFSGRTLMAQLETSLTYERIYGFAPGFIFRYQLFTGNPPADDLYAANNVTNHLISLGAVVYFKF